MTGVTRPKPSPSARISSAPPPLASTAWILPRAQRRPSSRALVTASAAGRGFAAHVAGRFIAWPPARTVVARGALVRAITTIASPGAIAGSTAGTWSTTSPPQSIAMAGRAAAAIARATGAPSSATAR